MTNIKLSLLEALVKNFSDVKNLPVEIPTVRDAIIGMGIQDNIIICPDKGMDPSVLRGLYYQYRYRPVMYGEPVQESLIVYCSNTSVPWQRVICCKELIHILDRNIEKTVNVDEIDGLINRLLGPLSTEEFDLFDIMAAKDRLALYQSLPILFPNAAREIALHAIEKDGKSASDYEKEACLPAWAIKLVLSEDWPALMADLGC